MLVWFRETKTDLAPVAPFLTPNFGLGGQAPTKIDYRKKGTLILTSLLEDLEEEANHREGSILRKHVGSPESKGSGWDVREWNHEIDFGTP